MDWRTKVLVGTVLGALGGAVYLLQGWVSEDQESVRQSEARQGDKLGSLRAEVRRLRGELRALAGRGTGARVERVEKEGGATDDAGAEKVGKPVEKKPLLDPEEARRRNQERTALKLENLMVEFDQERREAEWASEREAELSGAGEGFDGVQVASAECRSQLCVVELQHDTREAVFGYQKRVDSIDLARRFMHTDTEGGPPFKTTIYFGPKGHSMGWGPESEKQVRGD